MNHIELILTETEFMQQQCLLSSNSAIDQAIDGTLTGIVTYIKLRDGHYQTLSRYEDDQWTFPASKGTKAVRKNQLILNFSTITDIQMLRMAKWVIATKLKNGLALGSLRSSLMKLKSYFQWVSATDTIASHGLTTFTASAYVKHVNTLTSTQKGEIKPLSLMTKTHKFLELESLYQHCKGFKFIKEHPWPESSASEQAGMVGRERKETRTKARTPIIPDEVLIPLSQFTKGYLDIADKLLGLRDKLDAFVPTAKEASGQATQKRKYLQSITTEFDTLDDFNEALLLLRDSCIFWLLLTTGMRIHEILGIKRGKYRPETRDELTYYYIETVSQKTHTGLAEWIAPEIATQAMDILARYSKPFQTKLDSDLAQAKARQDHAAYSGDSGH